MTDIARLNATLASSLEVFQQKLGTPENVFEALAHPFIVEAFRLGWLQFVVDIGKSKHRVHWLKMMALEATARFEKELGPPKDDATQKRRRHVLKAYEAGWLTAASDLRRRGA
jgi:hypothetical protein